MSPEQARGEALDRRSDIFSFGAICFRCLTGRPAFEGEGDAETIDGILNRDPDWSKLPPNAPPALLKILRRCLAKDPADRYRHIGDVRLELRELIESRAWEHHAEAAPQQRKRSLIAPRLDRYARRVHRPGGGGVVPAYARACVRTNASAGHCAAARPRTAGRRDPEGSRAAPGGAIA
jgi:serine/threonine protein kinase